MDVLKRYNHMNVMNFFSTSICVMKFSDLLWSSFSKFVSLENLALKLLTIYQWDFKKELAPVYINGAAGVGVGVERLWGITMTTDIFVECMTQQYIQEAI